MATEVIRYSEDGQINIVQDLATGEFRCADQHDMDTLPVGQDLTQAEIDGLEG